MVGRYQPLSERPFWPLFGRFELVFSTLIFDGILEVGERLLRQGADHGEGDDQEAGGGVILYKVLKVFRDFKVHKFLKCIVPLTFLCQLHYFWVLWQ